MDHLVELLDRDLLGMAQLVAAGNVHGDVNAAEFAVQLPVHRANLLFIPDVADKRHHPPAQAADDGGGFLQALIVDIRDQQVGADLGQRKGRRAPHVLPGASDQGDPAGEIEQRMKHGLSSSFPFTT